MTLILELPTEAETRLNERAQTNNQTLTEYAREVLLREAGHMATAPNPTAERKRSRLSQMRGVGAEIWKDIGDAQEWINAQRDEWDEKDDR